MKKNIKLFLSLLAILIVPALCQASTTILSNVSPQHTITSGSDEQVYGSSGSNQITLEVGANAELINFPGQNSIQIQSSSDLFTMFRSGTMVTFQGSDGTILKIPATTDPQTIVFTAEESRVLQIDSGRVMLDDQEITSIPASIECNQDVCYTDIYMTPPDPDYIMASGSRYAPVNQIMVMFEETISSTEAESVISQMENDHQSLDLTVTGRIPYLNIFQLGISNTYTGTSEAFSELDRVKASLEKYDGVDVITDNHILSADRIENDDDNCGIYGARSTTDEESRSRCAFSIIDYYQAIPIFDTLSPTFHPVKVAVIDTGLDTTVNQFDDITVENLNSGGTLYDYTLVKHGTTVASVIAADNGDGLTNGIASRILGNSLTLQIGNCHDLIADRSRAIVFQGLAVALAARAVNQGARVVNMSFGSHSASASEIALQQDLWRRLFQHPASANTLFVTSAANQTFELNSTNDVPAGMAEDNLITVGGLESCDYETVWASSAYGPAIDIAAPATNIPVSWIDSYGLAPSIKYYDGNSYAAPIVSSMAAVIFSLDPGMSGADMKNFLTSENHTLPAPEEMSGKRVSLIRTVGSAMIQKTSGSNVEALIDSYWGSPNGSPDPVHYISNDLAGHIEYSISGPVINENVSLQGHDMFFLTEERFLWYGNQGTVQGGDIFIGFMKAQMDHNIHINIGSGFRIGETYQFTSEGTDVLYLTKLDPDVEYQGVAESGSIIFNECELTNRSLKLDNCEITGCWDEIEGLPSENSGMQVSGVLGTIVVSGDAYVDGTRIDDVTHTIEVGEFSVMVNFLGPDDDTKEYLEENCIGGYYYDPSL